MLKAIQLNLITIILYLGSPKFSYTDAYFDHLTTTDGLSQDKIICLLRDQTGFLWIGTETGLNKYDGKNIKIYKHDPDNPNSISNSFAQALLEDANGVLWIATYGGGLNKFDRITETFTHY